MRLHSRRVSHLASIPTLLGWLSTLASGQTCIPFAPPTSLPTLPGAGAVAVADLDGDGDQDFVVTSLATGSFTVRLGDGFGGFTVAPGSPVSVGHPLIGVAAGDLDGDGLDDLVVANHVGTGLGHGHAFVYRNVGGGAFALHSTLSFPNQAGPHSVTLGDLDGDGDLDLLAPSSGPQSGLYVSLGTSTGLFTTPLQNQTAGDSRYVALAHFDQDGVLDAAVTNHNPKSVSILLGLGGGAFGAANQISVGAEPQYIDRADFNLDGLSDLAVATGGSGTMTSFVTVLFGQGNGAFAPPKQLPAGSGPSVLVTEDVNVDGVPDIVTGDWVSGTITVIASDGAGGFAPPCSYPAAANSGGLGLGDFDVDGDPEVVSSHPSGVALVYGNPTLNCTVAFGTSGPSCTTPMTLSASSTPKVGNLGFALVCTGLPASSNALFVVAGCAFANGAPDPFGLGLTLYVDLFCPTLLAFSCPIDASGTSTCPLPIPPNPAFAGLSLHAQCIGVWSPLDPQCAPGAWPAPAGMTGSHGLTLTLRP